jgi:hypothetical protein
MACYIAEVALRVYLEDVKVLVANAIMPDIRSDLLANNGTIRDFAGRRNDALGRWQDSPYPLSMSPQTVQDLLRAITPRNQEIPDLPMSNLGNQSHSFIVTKIMKAIGKDRRRYPPFISGGNALPVMRIAVAEIQKVAADSAVHANEVEEFTSATLIHVYRCLRIDHIPWCMDAIGHRGNPPTKILHNKFLSIGGHDTASQSSSAHYLTQSEASSLVMQQSSLRIVKNNPAGEWSILDTGLTRYATMLHKSILPIECGPTFVSSMHETSLITQTYTWAIGQFNPANNVHKIVLFSALAVSCLLPNIFTQISNKPTTNATISEIEQYIRGLPCTSLSRKGLTDKRPFILLIFSLFMTLYDSSAPILSNNEVKKQWNAKYCKFDFFWNLHFIL